MEVASYQTSFPPHLPTDTNLLPDTMDTSMDIDMDLDLGPLPESEVVETAPQTSLSTNDNNTSLAQGLDEAQPEKVHIRGVDELTTNDIKQYAMDCFTIEEPRRIEWIDDTSANIVYSTQEMAAQALVSFTQTKTGDASTLPSLQLRSAKGLSSRPESVLQVRSAVQSDRKKPRAHEASRFYMMHPEHDPRERLRREFSERRRHGRRDDSGGEYRRRRYDNREDRRRKEGGQEFDPSMYDDHEETQDSSQINRSRRRGSGSELSSGEDSGGRVHRRGRRDGGDLFSTNEGRSRGRLRNRSASPGRDGSLDDDMNDDDTQRSGRRFRDRSPPPPYRARDPHPFPRSNGGKELFPENDRSVNVDMEGAPQLQSDKELFANKIAASKLRKELFPNKTPHSNHRRSDAFDAADETADLFGKRLSVPFVDGAAESNGTFRKDSIELFPSSRENDGMSIRGAASQQDQGVSIRGAAGLSIKGSASVKELFPSKYSNAGKELFSDKLEGRGGRRRRAEDMFY